MLSFYHLFHVLHLSSFIHYLYNGRYRPHLLSISLRLWIWQLGSDFQSSATHTRLTLTPARCNFCRMLTLSVIVFNFLMVIHPYIKAIMTYQELFYNILRKTARINFIVYLFILPSLGGMVPYGNVINFIVLTYQSDPELLMIILITFTN